MKPSKSKDSRTLVVGRKQAGRPVVELLRSYFRLSPQQVRELVKQRGILLRGQVCRDLTQRLRVGDRLAIKEQSSRLPERDRPEAHQPPPLPDLARRIRTIYEDEHVLVVDKPAGLTTVRHAAESAKFGARARGFLPATVVDFLLRMRAGKGKKGRIRAVHRLDKETSGLVVLALTPEAESHLGLQFRAHSTERTYLALVRGEVQEGRIESQLVADRGDGRRGSSPTGAGQQATTHVRLVEKLGAFALAECRLETGRTHQVRIHLGEAGMPLCGERVYDRPLHGKPQPDASNFARPALHAATLAFDHPVTGRRLSFQAPLPGDMKELRQRLAKNA